MEKGFVTHVNNHQKGLFKSLILLPLEVIAIIAFFLTPSTKPLRCQCRCRNKLRNHLYGQQMGYGIKLMDYCGIDPFISVDELQSCNCCIRHTTNKPSIHLEFEDSNIIPYSEKNPRNRKNERRHKSWYTETSYEKKNKTDDTKR